MRSAAVILGEISKGDFIREATDAIHKALQATMENGKESVVTLKISINQLTSKKLSEPAVSFSGEVTMKLAKPQADETIFFVDENGDPSRQPQRQQEMGLRVASESTATGGQGA